MPSQFGPAPAYHVMCLLLLLAAHPTNQDRCGEGVACRGERPTNPSGCCPVEAGHACSPANEEQCDVDLGFQCRSQDGSLVNQGTGICKGAFNLNVTSRGERHLGLSWMDFAPESYLYEYVLQYRAHTFNYDLDRWEMKECGADPEYTLTRLVPGTLYFVRVSIWEDGPPWTFRNSTETLMVETAPAEHCTYLDREYSVGDTFVLQCEDNCTCLASGEITCRELCQRPEGLPELEDGCHFVEGDSCCDMQVFCPVGGEPCEVNGTLHQHGTEFEDGCRECACMHGQVECIFPHTCETRESTPECPNPRSREIPGQCCPEWYCERSCSHDNRTFNHLEYFTSEQCGLCQCDVTRGVQCAPDCPPVSVVLPDAACPDPHVRRDGCCPTLHCFDPTEDITHLASRIFALSYSPASWTISFQVEPLEVDNEIPLFCEYEITYANSTDPGAQWTRRVVQPVDIRVNQDQQQQQVEGQEEETEEQEQEPPQQHSQNSTRVGDPSQVLTTESAVVVGDRAYLTVAGMYPNTTYYVRIRPLGGDLQDGVAGNTSSPGMWQSAAMVVVKTLPLGSATSCFDAGREVSHGSTVDVHCSKRCRCDHGQVICSSACLEEAVVIAASPSCPSPRLRTEPDHCCPTWSCFPSGSGCRHKDLILESGRSVYDNCNWCSCNNGTMTCETVCPPLGDPPRPDCQLTNITGHCCSQWKCPLDAAPPIAAEAAVILLFAGNCPKPSSNFVADLKEAVLSHISSFGQANQSQLSQLQHELSVHVVCPGATEKRKKRSLYLGEQNNIAAAVLLRTNFSSDVSKDEEINSLQSGVTQLYNLLLPGVQVTLNQGQTLTSSETKKASLIYLCEPGFSYLKETCVLTEIRSSPTYIRVSPLKVHLVAPSLVTMTWGELGHQAQRHVIGINVEFRLSGTLVWQRLAQVPPSGTSYTITDLEPDHTYQVRLVALTSWAGRHKWVISETTFRTDFKASSGNLNKTMSGGEVLLLEDPWISETCALFYWDPPPEEMASAITAVHVVYKDGQSPRFTNRAHLPSTRQTHVRLDGLNPGTEYVAKLVFLVNTGQAFESHDKQFVTTSSGFSKATLILVVSLSCVALVILALLMVTLLCVVKRRGKQKPENGGFENMVYGLPMENNNAEPEPAVNPSTN